MALLHVESLVLRGASVLRDGPAVGLRLGSYEGQTQILKATPFPKRHPSPGCTTSMPETSGRHNSAVRRAGRPGSRAGVLGRFAVGGPEFTAAARLCPVRAKQPASVADVLFRRASTLHDCDPSRYQRDERMWQGPLAGLAGPADPRTPPAASTRGIVRSMS